MGPRALQGPGQAASGSSLVLQPVCTRTWPAASAPSGGEQQASSMQVGPCVGGCSALLHLTLFVSLCQRYSPRYLTLLMLSPAATAHQGKGPLPSSSPRLLHAGLAQRASLASVQGLRKCTASLCLSMFACITWRTSAGNITGVESHCHVQAAAGRQSQRPPSRAQCSG